MKKGYRTGTYFVYCSFILTHRTSLGATVVTSIHYDALILKLDFNVVPHFFFALIDYCGKWTQAFEATATPFRREKMWCWIVTANITFIPQNMMAFNIMRMILILYPFDLTFIVLQNICLSVLTFFSYRSISLCVSRENAT